MRDSNFIKKDKSISRILGGLSPIPSGGGIPEGKEGEQYSHVKGRAPYPTLEPAEPSERALHEFAYNSETNGDGVKMFNLGRVRPS